MENKEIIEEISLLQRTINATHRANSLPTLIFKNEDGTEEVIKQEINLNVEELQARIDMLRKKLV